VFLQECERMNTLITEISRSLHELKEGLNGSLTMSERMETLQVGFSKNVYDTLIIPLLLGLLVLWSCTCDMEKIGLAIFEESIKLDGESMWTLWTTQSVDW